MSSIVSTVGDKTFVWHFDDDGSISLAGDSVSAEVQTLSPNALSLIINGRSYHILLTRKRNTYDVLIDGKTIEVHTEDSTKKLAATILAGTQQGSSVTEIKSPMPGMVVRCEVKEGAPVKAGDGLLILEAMKMENEIRATKGGIVRKILVSDRQVVEKGELLIVID